MTATLVLHRLEANGSVLVALAEMIGQNADKIPDFLELVLTNSLTTKKLTEMFSPAMARSIRDNIDKFSNLMELWDRILDHPDD